MKIIEQVKLAKQASFKIACASEEARNRALEAAAERIQEKRELILEENRKDLVEAELNGLQKSLYKRLVLNKNKIDQIVASIKDVVKLEDPIGRILIHRELDKSLELYKVSVPIGVLGVIFESRPDALVQISSLCLKSGNAVILKGGSEAKYSNRVLFDIITTAVQETDSLFRNCLHLAETREDIGELLKLDEYIDLMIPRGSNNLVKTIRENTKIPVLGHSDGICHLYIDKEADPGMALDISFDSKCQYPSVCNAIETLLVHRDIAEKLLPALKEKMPEVRLLGDTQTLKILNIEEAQEKDWSTEYNDLILSIKTVDSCMEAVDHINHFSSHHTDSIITDNRDTASFFMDKVDSSSVLWNCSTRFADGFRYGFGAEVGISTNKIHARGPVGLEGLTIYKYKVIGAGQKVADYVSGSKTFSHRDLK